MPREVRDDQAEEHDRPAGGGRRAAQHRDVTNSTSRVSRTRWPSATRDVLAQRQPVERPAARERDDDADAAMNGTVCQKTGM